MVNVAQAEFPGMPESSQIPEETPALRSARIKVEAARYELEVATRGALLLPAIAAGVLGISRQRVHQLLDAGTLTRLHFFGHTWVPLPELELRLAVKPSKGGRPRKESAA